MENTYGMGAVYDYPDYKKLQHPHRMGSRAFDALEVSEPIRFEQCGDAEAARRAKWRLAQKRADFPHPARGRAEWPSREWASEVFPANGIVVDVETTNTDAETGSVIEIGARRFALRRVALAQAGSASEASIYCGEVFRPWPCAVVEDGALAVNGCTRAQLDAAGKSFAEGAAHFFDWLGRPSLEGQPQRETKWLLFGWRAQFDWCFLLQSWLRLGRCERDFPFMSGAIDLRSALMAFLVSLGCVLPPDGLKSTDVARILGMSEEAKPHRAWRGAVWGAEGWARLTALQSEAMDFTKRSAAVRAPFGDGYVSQNESPHWDAFMGRLESLGYAWGDCPF